MTNTMMMTLFVAMTKAVGYRFWWQAEAEFPAAEKLFVAWGATPEEALNFFTILTEISSL